MPPRRCLNPVSPRLKGQIVNKGKIQAVLEALPSDVDDVDLDEFTERLYVLEKIEQGMQELEDGKGIPHADAKLRLSKWLT